VLADMRKICSMLERGYTRKTSSSEAPVLMFLAQNSPQLTLKSVNKDKRLDTAT